MIKTIKENLINSTYDKINKYRQLIDENVSFGEKLLLRFKYLGSIFFLGFITVIWVCLFISLLIILIYGAFQIPWISFPIIIIFLVGKLMFRKLSHKSDDTDDDYDPYCRQEQRNDKCKT